MSRPADVPRRGLNRPAMGRWLMLPFLALIVLAFLTRGRHASRPVPRTQHFAQVVSPRALHAGDVTAFSHALVGAEGLPQRFTLSGLSFRADSAEIDPGSVGVLDNVAQVMAAHPGARIQVEGPADSAGTREASQQLSQARAESTRAYLNHKGIGSERIEAVGVGADQPTASNDSAEIVLLER